MTIKKLTEELENLIKEPINELSDDTVQSMLNARKANVDKAVDKYAKATALASRRNKNKDMVTDKTLRPVLVGYVDDMNLSVADFKRLRSNGYIQDDGSGEAIIIPKDTNISIGKDNGKIIIIIMGIELVTNNITDKDGDDLSITDVIGASNEKRDIFDYIMNESEHPVKDTVDNLDALTVDQLIQIFNSGKAYESDDEGHSLYPSSWNYDEWSAYPAKLAEALSKSGDEENVGDFFNLYYDSYRGRDYDDDATFIFAEGVVEDWEEILNWWGDTPDYYICLFVHLISWEPDIVKNILQKFKSSLSEDAYKKLVVDEVNKIDDNYDNYYDSSLVEFYEDEIETLKELVK